MTESTLWFIALAAFILGAFYSGSETALIAADRIGIRHMAGKGSRRAKLVLELIDDPEYFLSVVLVGTNVASIGCAATFTAICTGYFGANGPTVATLILVPVWLVFSDIIPKGIFLYHANRAALESVYILRALTKVLHPVVWLFSTVADLSTRLLPRVELTQLHVNDVMVPREQIVMVDYASTTDGFFRAFQQAGYSRLPVYREERDNVVGVLSVHDLFKRRNADEIRSGLLPAYTVPLNVPIVDILFEMKEQGRHMAVVRDENGRMVGMTTLEDILERFVGAIADEFN
jgi:putative hemolysin